MIHSNNVWNYQNQYTLCHPLLIFVRPGMIIRIDFSLAAAFNLVEKFIDTGIILLSTHLSRSIGKNHTVFSHRKLVSKVRKGLTLEIIKMTLSKSNKVCMQFAMIFWWLYSKYFPDGGGYFSIYSFTTSRYGIRKKIEPHWMSGRRFHNAIF